MTTQLENLNPDERFSSGGIFGHIPETWGTGFNSTDWKLAAEEAARRIHNVNQDILIIVGGLLSNVVLSPAYYAPVQIPDQVSKIVSTITLEVIWQSCRSHLVVSFNVYTASHQMIFKVALFENPIKYVLPIRIANKWQMLEI